MLYPFADLGKDTRNLLFKKFHIGLYNIKLTSKSDRLEFTANIDDSSKPSVIYSNLQSKLKFPYYGATLSNKWLSSGVIDSEICFEDKLYKGLKQAFQIFRDPFKKCYHATLKNTYKTENINVDLEMFFKSALPDLSPSIVLGYQGYLAGADIKFDCENRILQKANFAVGYAVQDFAFHGLIMNWGKQFSANLYQRLTDRTQIASSITWKRVSDDITWSIGTEYTLDEQKKHNVKLKLDNLNQISVAFTTYLTKGFQFTLSGVFNGPDIPKMGIGFELDY